MKIYISLTSIYDNISSLLPTLQSLSQQKCPADRCYLFLSEKSYLLDKGFPGRRLPEQLSKFLTDHSLFELRWVDNTGPYRKLLPLLHEKWDEDCLIITVDDDTVYSPTLIEDYYNDYQQHKCCVSYRGFTMTINGSLNDLTYEKHDKLVARHLYNFHTGKGGVIYHPTFFKKTGDLIFNRSLQLTCCETGDDIWFNFIRIVNGIECYVNDQRSNIVRDLTTQFSLYRQYNMKDRLNTVNINKTVKKLSELGYLTDSYPLIFNGQQYWENRYQKKGTSGDGSYGAKAIFKGEYINHLLDHHQIRSIIDYGVGDGNQLKYIKTQGRQYIGLDISATAIHMCQQLFNKDSSKKFYMINDCDADRYPYRAELVMSNDVIYHLIDDRIYYKYMRHLFSMSDKYVLIHAVDNNYQDTPHVRFRKFTSFVQEHYPRWQLIEMVVNTLWVGKAGKMCFFLYAIR